MAVKKRAGATKSPVDIERLTLVLKLMKAHGADYVKLDGVEVRVPPRIAMQPYAPAPSDGMGVPLTPGATLAAEPTAEELMFYSAGGTGLEAGE